MNSDELTADELKAIAWDPQKNHDAITIIKQQDGNWRGFMWKDGKFIQVRQSDPGIVMQLLLTHP